MTTIAISGPGEVKLGQGVTIGKDVTITFTAPAEVVIGDYVSLGDGVRMVVGAAGVQIGDWTTLHANCLVMSTGGVSIGQHCWFGQHCVIDGTGGLQIRNGVRVGMFSQIWTHVAAGEQIEGCTLFGASPTIIEKDVWLVGTCTVGSGVVIGERTVALAGSNITKSCPAHVTLAGAPAKMKEGLSFYRNVSLDEKYDLLRSWLSDFAIGTTLDSPTLTEDETALTVHFGGREKVRFYKRSSDYDLAQRDPHITICCVEDKRYRKVFTTGEKLLLKVLEGNKARFYT